MVSGGSVLSKPLTILSGTGGGLGAGGPGTLLSDFFGVSGPEGLRDSCILRRQQHLPTKIPQTFIGGVLGSE